MNGSERAKTYRLMAAKDRHALSLMTEASGVAVEIFGFHVQQAVEKGLKAWLCMLEANFPKKHDLKALAFLIRQAGGVIPEEFLPLLSFTDFATTFRYDAYDAFDAPLNREEIVELVGRFLMHVDRLLDEGS
ncbi:MAG: HEPN domain-containing protein [Magnetococcus sp. YQC-9]